MSSGRTKTINTILLQHEYGVDLQDDALVETLGLMGLSNSATALFVDFCLGEQTRDEVCLALDIMPSSLYNIFGKARRATGLATPNQIMAAALSLTGFEEARDSLQGYAMSPREFVDYGWRTKFVMPGIGKRMAEGIAGFCDGDISALYSVEQQQTAQDFLDMVAPGDGSEGVQACVRAWHAAIRSGVTDSDNFGFEALEQVSGMMYTPTEIGLLDTLLVEWENITDGSAGLPMAEILPTLDNLCDLQGVENLMHIAIEGVRSGAWPPMEGPLLPPETLGIYSEPGEWPA